MNRSQVSVKWNQTTSIKKQEESYSLCVCVCLCVNIVFGDHLRVRERERERVCRSHWNMINQIDQSNIDTLMKTDSVKVGDIYTHTTIWGMKEEHASMHACMHVSVEWVSWDIHPTTSVERLKTEMFSRTLFLQEKETLCLVLPVTKLTNPWMCECFFCLYFTMSILTLCQWI